MRRLTDQQYRLRLAKAGRNFTPLEPYTKAEIELPVRCNDCGNVIVRAAFASIRFGCPHCLEIKRGGTHADE